MLDVVVLEAAQDMDDRVDFADVAEELVAQAFTLGCAAHKPGNVDEGKLGRDDLGRTGNRGQLVEARVGHADLADIGLDGAEGIIGCLSGLRLCERIEQGRLADIGQAHDPATETHVLLRMKISPPIAVRIGLDQFHLIFTPRDYRCRA